EDQRRRQAQCRRPERGGQDDVPELGHRRTRYSVRNRATSMVSSAVATITSAMKDGTPCARAMASAPTNTAATKIAAGTTPKGFRLASIATITPAVPKP